MPKVPKAPIDKYLRRIAVGMANVCPLLGLDIRRRATRKAGAQKRLFRTLLQDAIREELKKIDPGSGKTYAAVIGQSMLESARQHINFTEGQSGNPSGKPKPEEPSVK